MENSDIVQTQPSQGGGSRRRNHSDGHHLMYKACIEGDCVAAEVLLGKNPNLGRDKISEEGDRALHVAASMKHKQLVRKLVEKLSPSELALHDGRGYTACCYAAISGSVGIAFWIMRKNPSLGTARDKDNKTPLEKAAFQGNEYMVLYLLKYAKARDLSTQEWFDLLLLTIRRRAYGAALKILETNEHLTTMSNDEGTALHLLAKQRFYVEDRQKRRGEMQIDMRLLAEKLLASIQKLPPSYALGLMKNPPILHDAAKVGNIELITMLTHEYPHLICLTNGEGHTIFHIAVIHRNEKLFGLINEIGARKELITLTKDGNGNNILHLVAELPNPKRWIIRLPALEMQREVLWYEKVRDTVPPECRKMKNKDGETGRELFLKGHKKLLDESYSWMKSASESCMLIATLIFTVVFAFAFSVPGGHDSSTGAPVVVGKTWFTVFVIFEVFAMFSSAGSILCFLNIVMYGVHESHFARVIPLWFVCGLVALSVSVLAAISAFVSAFFLIYFEKRSKPVPAIILSLITVGYLIIFILVGIQIYALLASLPRKSWWRTHYTLYKKPQVVMKSTHASGHGI